MTPETAGIEQVFSEHQARLNGFCYRLIGDRETASDITQEVFLHACQVKKCEPAWLYVCARSRCTDYLRRRGVWKRVHEVLQRNALWSYAFEDELADKDLGWSLLRRLPEKSGSLLLLRAYAGLSYEELAGVLGTTPQTVAVMLHRARKRASELLKGDDRR